MYINGISSNFYQRKTNQTFSGTSNAVSKGIDVITEQKFFTKKTGYIALGALIAGTLGYLVLKPENEATKHASRYIPKN